MAMPKAWERDAWAKCPDCGTVLKLRERHICNGFEYKLYIQIQARWLGKK